MQALTLFDDQIEFVDKLRLAIRQGHKSILGVASPAFGKTVVAGHIIAQARARSPRASAWFLVHRKNLLAQTSKSFWRDKIEHGLLTSGRIRSLLPIQVGTIGTVYSRLAKLTAPTILFVDEAHLAGGNMFSTVIQWALDGGALVIGLTGTPQRLDGKPLGNQFQVMVEARTTSWLIEQGRLSRYRYYAAPHAPDLSGVKKQAGDWNKTELAEAMGKRVITGDAISHWIKYAYGLITVIYCCNVKHSKATAEAFTAAGIPTVHVDADTTAAELQEACQGLATGKYLAMSNCELVIEGFDLSMQAGADVTIECCILLRPTESVARYLQMVFRSLRRKPRPAIILDHAGCAMRHGFPDDDREWSLDGSETKQRKKNDDEVKAKQCGKCYAIFKPNPSHCPTCGESLTGKERKIEVTDGELIEVDIEAMRREQKREQGSARTLADLVALGLRRGQNRPAEWAANVMAGRQGRRPTPGDYKAAREHQEKLKEVWGHA